MKIPGVIINGCECACDTGVCKIEDVSDILSELHEVRDSLLVISQFDNATMEVGIGFLLRMIANRVDQMADAVDSLTIYGEIRKTEDKQK